MEKAKIDRINELAHKSKDVGLTVEEKQEQKILRQEFIAAVVGDVRATLDNVEIVDKNDPLKS